MDRFRRLARELRIAIAITYLETGPTLPRNTLTLVDSEGADIFTYAKVHICAWDAPEESCAPGDEFCVGDVRAGAEVAKIGAMICFDREFPESARLLMLKGAEVVLTPNACELLDDAAALRRSRPGQRNTESADGLSRSALTSGGVPTSGVDRFQPESVASRKIKSMRRTHCGCNVLAASV